MKLHQLRSLAEIAKQGLSFSKAAAALNASQPGISKQIRLLEEELEVDLFIRNGNRIMDLTEPGRRIVEIANLILRQMDNVKITAKEYTGGDTGRLNVAATFTLARYVLPEVFRRFTQRYPKVEVNLVQGSSSLIAQRVATGESDIAVITRPRGSFPDLLLLDHCALPRALLMPAKHPLVGKKKITLRAISAYPLITLDAGSLGQTKMRNLFTSSGLAPRIVFTGADVDVVKAFVEAGLGIAVLPAVSYDPVRDPYLRATDVSHLFESHIGCLGIRKSHYLRGFAFDFIEMLAPDFTRDTVREALLAARTAA